MKSLTTILGFFKIKQLLILIKEYNIMFTFYYIDELTNFFESGVKHPYPQNGHSAYCA